MNIEEFCAKEDDSRHYLHKPFNFEDRTIATDGLILLSAPRMPGYEDHIKKDNLQKTITDILVNLKNANFTDVDNIIFPSKSKCRVCHGNEKAKTTNCEECDGEGEIDLDSDFNTYHGLTCKACDGSGETTNLNTSKDCPKCGGDGQSYTYRTPIKICGIHVDPNLLKKVIDNNGIQFAGFNNMLGFKCGEQEGVIMGMRV